MSLKRGTVTAVHGGGKMEQMCPRAAAALQDRAVPLLDHSQDKPCAISPTVCWWVTCQSPPGAGRSCRLSAGLCPSGTGQQHPPTPTAPCITHSLSGEGLVASYATKNIRAEDGADQVERQTIILISNSSSININKKVNQPIWLVFQAAQ